MSDELESELANILRFVAEIERLQFEGWVVTHFNRRCTLMERPWLTPGTPSEKMFVHGDGTCRLQTGENVPTPKKRKAK